MKSICLLSDKMMPVYFKYLQYDSRLFLKYSISGTTKDTFQFPSAGKRLPEIIILL